MGTLACQQDYARLISRRLCLSGVTTMRLRLMMAKAIPKSSHKERMAQNFDVFDFSLSDDDMVQIAQMNQHDTGTINFGDPQFVKYLIQNYG